MTTDSGDTTPVSGEHQHGTGADGTSSDMKSPYDIGLAADEEETGPKPTDPELEKKQIRGEA